jgi:uncharacterized RDD family membrane protein YckC
MNPLMEYASFGRRTGALFLDWFILFIPFAVANHIVPILGGVIVFVLYAPILESSALEATLGKYWMGIQVKDAVGRRVSFKTALLRNIAKIFSTSFLFLGFIPALFTRQKQSLHDLMVGTIVVFGRSESTVASAWENSVRNLFRSPLTAESAISKLEKLQDLRERGALTEEEFQAQKSKLQFE